MAAAKVLTGTCNNYWSAQVPLLLRSVRPDSLLLASSTQHHLLCRALQFSTRAIATKFPAPLFPNQKTVSASSSSSLWATSQAFFPGVGRCFFGTTTTTTTSAPPSAPPPEKKSAADSGRDEAALKPHDSHKDQHHGHEHHDSRAFLQSDGCRRTDLYTGDEWHWPEEVHEFDQPNVVMVDGQKMILGEDKPPMETLYCLSQANINMYPRTRMFTWVNYPFIMKAEFLFFWLPTFIIFSIAVPCYTLLYMMDEAVYTTMTIKVIGRQWYWVYEVESPPLEEEE